MVFPPLSMKIQEIEGVVWDEDHSCYRVGLNQKNKHKVYWHFRKNNYCVDYSAFLRQTTKTIKQPIKVLSEEKEKALKEFILYLKGKRYSTSTLNTYATFIKQFLLFVDKKLTELKNRDVERSVVSRQLNWITSTDPVK